MLNNVLYERIITQAKDSVDGEASYIFVTNEVNFWAVSHYGYNGLDVLKVFTSWDGGKNAAIEYAVKLEIKELSKRDMNSESEIIDMRTTNIEVEE